MKNLERAGLKRCRLRPCSTLLFYARSAKMRRNLVPARNLLRPHES